MTVTGAWSGDTYTVTGADNALSTTIYGTYSTGSSGVMRHIVQSGGQTLLQGTYAVDSMETVGSTITESGGHKYAACEFAVLDGQGTRHTFTGRIKVDSLNI